MRRFATRTSVLRMLPALPLALLPLVACFPTYAFGPVGGDANAADGSGDAASDDGPSESTADEGGVDGAVDGAVDEDADPDASSADDAG